MPGLASRKTMLQTRLSPSRQALGPNKEEEAGMHWIALVFWFGICFVVGGIGSWWTAGEITEWYRDLHKPAFTPPNRVFGPVWTLLYALMAVAVWLLAEAAPSPFRTCAVALFVVQLALNLAWPWLFFRVHAIGAALLEVLLLWVAIGCTLAISAIVEPIAAWLMAPYWAWITFATILNAALWRLNKRRPDLIWSAGRQGP
jgi:translocator protein